MDWRAPVSTVCMDPKLIIDKMRELVKSLKTAGLF